MSTDLLKKYLPKITEQQISDDVYVEVVSVYGGMTCAIIKVSEVIEFVDIQERILDSDYFLSIKA